MKRILALLPVFAASPAPLAGDAVGFVTEIEIGTDRNAALFGVSGENSDAPGCNETDRYALSLITPSGKAAYELMLEAKANKYVVRVEGTKTCKFYWKAEDVLTLTIQ